MSLIIPPDFSVGIIIGNRANIKNVQTQSGAKVYVDTPKMTVIFKGTSAQVQIARAMIEQQINNWRKKCFTPILPSPNFKHPPTNYKNAAFGRNKKRYPYQCFSAVVLSPTFKDIATNSQNIRYKDVRTPKDTARDHGERMYRLDLNARDELAATFESPLNFDYCATPIPDRKKRIFYTRDHDWSGVMSAYKTAVKTAVKTAADFKYPWCYRLRLRIHFGAQLFYTKHEATSRLLQSRGGLKLSDELGMAVGPNHHLQACYSNKVSSKAIDRIRKFLPEIGFTPSLVADVIICHGKNMKTRGIDFNFDGKNKPRGIDFKFNVKYDKEGKRKIRCTEIRPKYTRIAIMSFVYPATIENTTENSDLGPDFRCRILRESRIPPKMRKKLMSLVKGCIWSEVTKKIHSNLGEFEPTLYKKRELFTGKFNNIKVEVELLNVTNDGDRYWEMEVTSPDCNANLTDHNLFDSLITFCDKLRVKATE